MVYILELEKSYRMCNLLVSIALSRGPFFWESRLKESCDTYKTHHSNTHAFSTYSDGSDDENQECMVAEIRWPVENKIVGYLS
jgi:hypothetical protein